MKKYLLTFICITSFASIGCDESKDKTDTACDESYVSSCKDATTLKVCKEGKVFDRVCESGECDNGVCTVPDSAITACTKNQFKPKCMNSRVLLTCIGDFVEDHPCPSGMCVNDTCMPKNTNPSQACEHIRCNLGFKCHKGGCTPENMAAYQENAPCDPVTFKIFCHGKSAVYCEQSFEGGKVVERTKHQQCADECTIVFGTKRRKREARCKGDVSKCTEDGQDLTFCHPEEDAGKRAQIKKHTCLTNMEGSYSLVPTMTWLCSNNECKNSAECAVPQFP